MTLQGDIPTVSGDISTARISKVKNCRRELQIYVQNLFSLFESKLEQNFLLVN